MHDGENIQLQPVWPGFDLILGPGVVCGLSYFDLFLVLSLLQEVFLPVLRFSPILKTNIAKFQFDLESGEGTALSVARLLGATLVK